MTTRRTAVTTRRLCLALGISKSKAIRWSQEGCPHAITPKGFRWDMPAVRRWVQDTHTVPSVALNAAKLRALNLRCEELEYRFQQERAKYVRRTTVEAYLTASGTQVRTACMAIADTVAPLLAVEPDQHVCHAIMTAAIRKALTDLADNLVQWHGGNYDTHAAH